MAKSDLNTFFFFLKKNARIIKYWSIFFIEVVKAGRVITDRQTVNEDRCLPECHAVKRESWLGRAAGSSSVFNSYIFNCYFMALLKQTPNSRNMNHSVPFSTKED